MGKIGYFIALTLTMLIPHAFTAEVSKQSLEAAIVDPTLRMTAFSVYDELACLEQNSSKDRLRGLLEHLVAEASFVKKNYPSSSWIAMESDLDALLFKAMQMLQPDWKSITQLSSTTSMLEQAREAIE